MGKLLYAKSMYYYVSTLCTRVRLTICRILLEDTGWAVYIGRVQKVHLFTFFSENNLSRVSSNDDTVIFYTIYHTIRIIL